MNAGRRISLLCFAGTLVGVLGAKCPSVPSVQETAVELVKTESAVIGPFEARGKDLGEDGMVDLVAEYDIAGALDEASIRVEDVESITVRLVEVRVSRRDPDDERTINNGTVMAQRVATPRAPEGSCPIDGGFQTVVSDWSGRVNAYQSFSATNVQVDPAGIDLLNCLLDVYLQALRNGQNPDDLSVAWTVGGTMTPAGDADFDWEIRLTIDIVGTVVVDVLG